MDGLMDGRTVRLLYASQSSFGGIKKQACKELKIFKINPDISVNILLADDSNEISSLIFTKTQKIISNFVVCCIHDWCFKF